MSLLSQLFSGITGNDNNETVTLPCDNCESGCKAYPGACEECKPYKTRLIDALYNVEHIDAFYEGYEVLAEGSSYAGTTECPFCGAPANAAVCEFCGSRIAESNGKLQVKSASEIPNPIIEARNIIYERRSVIDKYTDGAGSDSSGILGSIVSALTGRDKNESSLGVAMTESEIKAMAEKYGVSVRDYLEGLDMGTYLTNAAYKKQEALSSRTSSSPTAAGLAIGAAGVGSAIGMLSGNGHTQRPPQPGPQPGHHNMGGQGTRPPMGGQGTGPRQSGRPPMGNQGQFRPDNGNHQGGRPSGNASNGGRPSGHGSHGGGPGSGRGGRGPGGGRGR